MSTVRFPDPRSIRIADYHYDLPEDRIAKFPLEERDRSRLLIWKEGAIREDIYRNIAAHLPAGSTLVFNNTKVVEARILFRKPSGGIIEIFTLEPDERYPDIQTAMLEKKEVYWKCLVGGASKWKKGMILEKKIDEQTLFAEITAHLTDCFLIRLSWTHADITFAEVLHQAGIIPLPPYLKRESEASDKERYQTIYAQAEGSVAAPTAGLHFTDHIFQTLREKKTNIQYVTLHVGAGTFKPVKSTQLEGHDMHAEFIDVNIQTLKSLVFAQPIYVVGTTSLRTLESLYWMGVKCSRNPDISFQELEMQQWEIYDKWMEQRVPADTALNSLIGYMEKKGMNRLICKTKLLITPGYPFGLVKGIVTNFHQPQSTLLLLIAAFTGEKWKTIYQHALDNGYRFLSYGDGMIIV
jgi:S-adenosylmethionine:tRNA ribosyltransferase-isomerase